MNQNLTNQQRKGDITHGKRDGLCDSKNYFRLVNGHVFSYTTCLVATLPDGSTIGNDTYYSNTTSRHQTKAGVRSCDVVVIGVPENTADLSGWFVHNFFDIAARDGIKYKGGALPAALSAHIAQYHSAGN